jgi:hypothetical protein
MRFFGDNHVIRGNFMGGTDFSEIGSAHVDCFQTFDNNGEYGHDILIEGNTCYNFHQGFMGEASFHHDISHITFRNNVFAHGLAWGLSVHDIHHITVENNTFYDIQHHGAGFRDSSHSNLVVNNIFMDTGTSYWAADGGSVSGDHNLIFGSNEPGTPGPHDLIGVDPSLADPEGNDFHPLPGSPAIDAGQVRPDVTVDLEGVPRPQGAGFDIGAYEFGGPSPTFLDVPASHWAFEDIEILYDGGYIAGCSLEPLKYCPDRTMDRAESAVFILRGVHGASFEPPLPAEPIFSDVGLSEWFADWTAQLWVDGYTAGCGTDPLRYCPGRQHTHAEGSVFFLRMKHGADYVPPPAEGLFEDVAPDAWYADWVEAAYREGILPLCQTEPQSLACPESPLDRATGAFMMVRAKGLDQ